MRIVTCPDGTDLDALIAEFNLKPKFIYRALSGFAAPMDDATVDRLRAHQCVLFVEHDAECTLLGWSEQTNSTGLVRTGVDRFPVGRINGVLKMPLDVDVAVMDTGIDPHPDLNVYTNIAIGSETVRDFNDHGTLVAGVLGAKDNAFGVVGVAPGIRLWNIKLADDFSVVNPPILMSYVASAMNLILQHSNRISIVNMSFASVPGSTPPFNGFRLGINRLINAGIVVVAGVGNWMNDIAGPDGKFGPLDSDRNLTDDTIPAAFPQVMAVSAMDPVTDTFWPQSGFNQTERVNNAYPGLSNYVFSPGGAIDVTAPGANIITTTAFTNVGTNGGYRAVSGTSLATAHVSGLVALYIAANGRATNAEGAYRIRQAIIDASLPQSHWNTTNTMDPDTNPEPLAIASEAWVPKPAITNHSGAPGAFQLSFATVPGYDYAVQSTDDLTPPVTWTQVAQVSGSNFVSSTSATDSNVTSRSFYRLARRSALELPAIVSQSRDLRVPAGANANLSVRAVGLAPLSYQWHKTSAPLTDNENISGATTATLILSNVQSSDAGPYVVVITNDFGSATNLVATLTVLTNWTSTKVTGVVATATSELGGHPYYREASNTVNGAIAAGAFWETVGVAQPRGHDPEPAITFDLGTPRALERMQIWNGPEAGPAARRLEVQVSDDGVLFHSLGEFTLTMLSPDSESISLGGVVARYVRFVFLENWNGQPFPAGYAPYDGTGYIEIDEVEFHEYAGN